MSALDAPAPTDAAELQNVLTRYVDSVDGYQKAAEIIANEQLAAAFSEISARRLKITERVSRLISSEGGRADESGSAEALIHRWWIALRTNISEEELGSTLAECLRGEKELQRAVKAALIHGNLKPQHQEIIADMAVELDDTVHVFETSLNF